MDKLIIKNTCLKIVLNKLQDLQSAINEAQMAANNETKSTAGDKHDTAKAHAQNETERLGMQMAQFLSMQQGLMRLPLEDHEKIQVGSYVESNRGNFYISAALGKVKTEQNEFFAISLNAPVGQLLFQKAKGEHIMLPNGEICVIVNVF